VGQAKSQQAVLNAIQKLDSSLHSSSSDRTMLAQSAASTSTAASAPAAGSASALGSATVTVSLSELEQIVARTVSRTLEPIRNELMTELAKLQRQPTFTS